MNEFFQRITGTARGIWGKLSQSQRLILIGVVALVLVGFIFLISFSTRQAEALLFHTPLEGQEYQRVVNKLVEWNVDFRERDGLIVVSDEDTGALLRMRLGQEGALPSGIRGWELFDTQSWTTTDFERDIKLRRAIIGEMTRHLKMLKDIEDVSIQITMPEAELFIDNEEPVTASVIITPAPFSDILTNEKKIKGIVNLVAFGVDKLKPENVVVTDPRGNILSDFAEREDGTYLTRAREEFKIKEKLRVNLQRELARQLKAVLGEDRVDISLEVELDFDQKKIEKTEYIPMVIKEDNPLTPYDESEVQANVLRSEKAVDEKFEGAGFVPEGPPGVEPNVPPGYKEALQEGTRYQKNETVKNYEISQMVSRIDAAPYRMERVSAAVMVDGTWKKLYDENSDPILTEEGGIKREYLPRSPEEMRKYEDIVRGAIGYDPRRGDRVVVKNIQFDRTEQFALEDAYIRRKEQLRKTLLSALIALFAIFIVTLAYRAISREVSRRKRLREEELARQQQLMREAALRSAEEEGAEVELSPEERARLEMQENVMNIAREHPEEVAKLIRTWLAEE